MDIALGGAQTRVAEQGLQGCDGHPRLGHAPPESVTKLVTGEFLPGFLTNFSQNELNPGHRQALFAAGKKNRPVTTDRAAVEPTLERILRLWGEIDGAVFVPLAMRLESGRTVQGNIVERKVVNLAYPQAAVEHQAKNRPVAWIFQTGEQYLYFIVAHIARQGMCFGEKMPAWNNRNRGRVILGHGEEVVECVQCCQSPVDGSWGMALLLAMSDEIVDYLDINFGRWFPGPGKKEHQVTGVVKPGAAGRVLAGEPVLKLLDFRVHDSLLA